MDKRKITEAVRRYQNGETEYLTEIYELTYSNLFVYSQYIMKDKEKAEDLLQDTYVEVIKSINNLKDPEAFLTWSKRIMYNLSCHAFGETTKENVVANEEATAMFDSIEEEDSEYIPEENFDAGEVQKIVRDIVEELPLQQRVAMVAYYFDELPIKQIAEILDTSENTIKTRLFYGRRAVKAKIEAFEKKNDVRLHAIVSVPFLGMMMKQSAGNIASTFTGDAATNLLQNIQQIAQSVTGSGIGDEADGTAGVSETETETDGTVETTQKGTTSRTNTSGGEGSITASEGTNMATENGDTAVSGSGTATSTIGKAVGTGAAVGATIAVKKIIAIIVVICIAVGGGVGGYFLHNHMEKVELGKQREKRCEHFSRYLSVWMDECRSDYKLKDEWNSQFFEKGDLPRYKSAAQVIDIDDDTLPDIVICMRTSYQTYEYRVLAVVDDKLYVMPNERIDVWENEHNGEGLYVSISKEDRKIGIVEGKFQNSEIIGYRYEINEDGVKEEAREVKQGDVDYQVSENSEEWGNQIYEEFKDYFVDDQNVYINSGGLKVPVSQSKNMKEFSSLDKMANYFKKKGIKIKEVKVSEKEWKTAYKEAIEREIENRYENNNLNMIAASIYDVDEDGISELFLQWNASIGDFSLFAFSKADGGVKTYTDDYFRESNRTSFNNYGDKYNMRIINITGSGDTVGTMEDQGICQFRMTPLGFEKLFSEQGYNADNLIEATEESKRPLKLQASMGFADKTDDFKKFIKKELGIDLKFHFE